MSPNRLQVWFLAARPKTLWAAVAPVIVGVAMAAADGAFVFLTALAALLGAVLIQIGTNLANDYADFKTGADAEDRLGPMRVTQAGLVSPAQMKRAIGITFGLAVLDGLYLVAVAGWPVVVIGVLSIAFGLMYTGGPFPLGYHGLGEIFVFVFFGLVAVAGTYYVQALRLTLPVVLAGVAPGLFSVAILAVNNLRDIESDRRSGKRTLAVRYGRVFARAEYVLAVGVASLMPITLMMHRPKPIALAATICLALAARPILHVCRSTDGPTLNGVLAATGLNLLAYSLLFALGWLL